jgi:alpha-glucosidase
MTWALGNHDAPRFVTRWEALEHLAGDCPRLVRLCLTLLACLRGNLCIYQGEELGLTEADVPAHRLLDPYGIEFRPVYKGRDGCRTPMPWCAQCSNAGFTEGPHPWLPVDSSHFHTRSIPLPLIRTRR